jgi:hypothetical protein
MLIALACYAGIAASATDIAVDGVGASREKAISNAILAANEQVSGVFLASDQRLEDGKITKDEIRQHTAGVVNSYEVVSCATDSGLFTCRIKAEVSPAPLRRTVEASGQSVAFVAGASAAAESMTYNQSLDEGRVLLLKTLGEWRSYVKPNIVNTAVLPSASGTPSMAVEYKIEMLPGYMKHLQAILKRVEKTNLKLNGRNTHSWYNYPIESVTLSGDEIGWWPSSYNLYDTVLSEALTNGYKDLRGQVVQVTLLGNGNATVATGCDIFQTTMIDQPYKMDGYSYRILPIRGYPEIRRVHFGVPQDKLAQVENVKVSIGCTDRGNLTIIGPRR